jgi:hypothetical protein
MASPRTSNGRTYSADYPRTWRCRRCGETGPDRDDYPLSGCKELKVAMTFPPHDLEFLEPKGSEL